MLARSKIMALGVLSLTMVVMIAACAPASAPPAPAQAPAAAANVPAANSYATPAASSSASSSSNAAAAAPGPIVLEVVSNDQLGKFLADGKGMTLYMFTKDTKDTSNCYDKCATAWPPLLQSEKPSVKEGVDASLLGTTTRKDGTIQVTYAGMPLYYYFEDTAPGNVLGQNSNNVWYVVAPDGTAIKK